MAAYELLAKTSAAKELDVIGDKDRRRIVDRIAALANDPRPPGCQKLSGSDKYRVRRGHYRVVYLVDNAAQQGTVFKIAHRRDVYR